MPETKRRTYIYRSEDGSHFSSSHFSSPENAVLTHGKIGSGPIQAFDSPDQIADRDPECTPLWILYQKNNYCPSKGLQKGDVLDESYVYALPLDRLSAQVLLVFVGDKLLALAICLHSGSACARWQRR